MRAALRQVGEERYHHKHPFHLLMHEGKLSRGQLQAWALNRYYYQSIIPMKDAIILSRATDPSFRRVWRKRIVDHDGDEQRKGGILRWIKLAEATGLDRERVMSGGGSFARYALYRKRISQPGADAAISRVRRFVADRTFFARPDHAAHGEIASALSLACFRARLF